MHYIRFKRLMKKIFDKIVFDDIEVDYTGYLENDIKRYIFAKSDRYDYYLQCLKNYFGVAEYRKEKRRTNELLKRMDSLPKGELTAEIHIKYQIFANIINTIPAYWSMENLRFPLYFRHCYFKF